MGSKNTDTEVAPIRLDIIHDLQLTEDQRNVIQDGSKIQHFFVIKHAIRM